MTHLPLSWAVAFNIDHPLWKEFWTWFNTEIHGVPDEGVIFDGYTEEEWRAAEKDFKVKAKALIKSYIAFDAFKEQQEKAFQDAMTAKKKEMNKEMKDCFAILDGVDEIKKRFLASVPKKEEKKTA